MINSIYQLVNKGSWRALSFILAIVITLCFFFNIDQFATALRNAPVLSVCLILWATVVLWIHGIGFDIRFWLWKLLFLPYIGYLGALMAIILHFS
ncbi:MAG: cyd operon protein YbgE [Pasteurellaceae bacterium]|nr:cyd operon protein YbgE [Pasteurellaceae bacterium]